MYSCIPSNPQKILTYQDFMASWEIQQVMSLPRYPISNGFIKRQVRTVKNTKKKKKKSVNRTGCSISLAATESDACLQQPPISSWEAYERKLTTTLPSSTEPVSELQAEKLAERCEKKTRNCNRHAGEQLSPLHQGQPAWVLDHDTRKWKSATDTRIRDEPHSYVVALDNGSALRRNSVDLRTRAKSSTDPDDQSPSLSGRHGNGNFHQTQDYMSPSTSSYLDRQGEITENQGWKKTLQLTQQNPGQKENIQPTQKNSELSEHQHQQNGHQSQTTRSSRTARIPKRYQDCSLTKYKDAHHKPNALRVLA